MYFPNINILRFFAAFSVLFYHIIEYCDWKDFPIQGPALWFRTGWLGVDIFFVVSGFVITLSAKAVGEKYGGNSWRVFLTRRFFRIFPLYLATCVVYSVFVKPEIIFENKFFFDFLAHIFFVNNLFPDFHRTINPVTWTLAVEVQFYLFMAVFIRFIHKKPYIFFGSAIVFSVLYKLISFLSISYFDLSEKYSAFFLSTQFFGCLDEFSFGVILAHIYLQYKDSIERQRKFLFLFLLTLFVFSFYLIYVKLLFLYGNYWDNVYMVSFWRLGSGFCFFLLVFMFVLLSTHGWIKKILTPFNYLGEISYGIYLWHLPVIFSLQKTVIAHDPEVMLIMTTLITFFLSILSWHFLEKRMIERGKNCLFMLKNID